MSYRLGFVMEQTLGHVTHAKNLQYWVGRDPEVIPTWIPVDVEQRDGWDDVPMVKNNWTLRSSLRARSQVRAALRTHKLDGLFFHTPVIALFSQSLMKKLPTVVSMDATPINIDAIGAAYDHRPSSIPMVESIKTALNRRTFQSARRLIGWCEWAKDSLVRDYGIQPEKIAVIPPGVDLESWKSVRSEQDQKPTRLLFVGGDFRRKGGDTLLQAYRDFLHQECVLDIVTRDPVDTAGMDGVRVHRGLGSNAPELMALYATADIFVFPTQADVLPLAIMEAMASSLPIITTAVGAIREEVEPGVTGFLIPPGDARGLAEATLRVARNSQLRHEMGVAARRAADQKFNAAKTYAQVLSVCKQCVDEDRNSARISR